MKCLYLLSVLLVLSCQRNDVKKVSIRQDAIDSTLIVLNFEKGNFNRDSSIFYFSTAKKIMLKNGSQRCLAHYLFLEGKRNLMIGQLDSVTFFADSGLRIKYLPKNRLYKGKFYNLKANVSGFERNIYESLDFYTKAEKIFMETKDSNSLAGIYSNITNSYFSLKDYKTGLEYSTKAYNLLNTVLEDRIKTNILITHSLALAKNNQLKNAFVMQVKADSISKITQDVMARMSVAIGYAEIYKSSKENDLAKKKYLECIGLSKITGVKHFELMSQIGLLSLYEESSENAKIIQIADSLLELAHLLNNLDVVHTSKRIIGRAYAKNKEYENAFNYLNDSYSIYDSTAGVENQKNINELRVKYSTEKSEKEILQQKLELSEQNQQLQKTKLTVVILCVVFIAFLCVIFILRKLNKTKLIQINLENQKKIQTAIIDGEEKERKRLAFEIHDGIASMITGISYKLASAKSEKQEVLNLLNQLHEESRNIAHNLMPVDFGNRNLIDTLKMLCNKMTTEDIEILLMTKEKRIDLSVGKSQLIYRIIQELMNNALKHSNCKSIFIKIEVENQNMLFSVCDDGIGMNEEKIENGFISIRERVTLLNGTIVFKSEENEGAEIEICVSNE